MQRSVQFRLPAGRVRQNHTAIRACMAAFRYRRLLLVTVPPNQWIYLHAGAPCQLRHIFCQGVCIIGVFHEPVGFSTPKMRGAGWLPGSPRVHGGCADRTGYRMISLHRFPVADHIFDVVFSFHAGASYEVLQWSKAD